MKNIFIVDWQVYPFSVIVALGVTKNELLNYARKYLTPTDTEYIERERFDSGKTVFSTMDLTILWLEEYPEIGSPILAHEVFHAVTFLMEEIGMPLNRQNNEAYAYAIEYLTKQINNNLYETRDI